MKKIIILLMGLSSFIFAEDALVFYVDSPEMVDMYFMIFSSIARVFENGDYKELLRLVFLMGGVFVFAGGLFKSFGVGGGEGALGGYLKYLIIGVSLLTLTLSWRGGADILIKSKTLPSVCDPTASETAGVAIPSGDSGVPTLLAYSYYFTNQIGVTLTDLAVETYSTVYSDPYQGMNKNNGYMGALKGAIHLMTVDPNKISLKRDNNVSGATIDPFDYGKAYKSLFTDCILIPFSGKGIEGEKQLANLKSSSNLQQYLKDLYTGGGVNVGGTNSRDFSLSYGGEIYNCGTFYDNVINPMDSTYNDIVGCGIPVGYGAVSLITGAGSDSAVTSDFQQVAIQAGLVSQLEESTASLGVGVSGVAYASGKTKAEFIQSSLASGVYMAEMLPYIQMTIRALLYAFFPFVFVIVLLPGGIKVLGNYFQSLIWVELWSPTAAILDLFMSTHASSNMKEMYTGEGLTMMNSVDMLSTGSTIAGVAGYLYLSVPALTWLILKGSAQMLQGITQATAAGMATNIKTDSMNRDTELLKKTDEFKATHGERYSMAEMQHYEAMQTGAVAGAVLGTQADAGLDTMTGLASAKENKDIRAYEKTVESTGVGGSHLGNELATAETLKNTIQVETGHAQTGIDGNLNTLGEANVEVSTNKELGTVQNMETNLNNGNLSQGHFEKVASHGTAKEDALGNVIDHGGQGRVENVATLNEVTQQASTEANLKDISTAEGRGTHQGENTAVQVETQNLENKLVNNDTGNVVRSNAHLQAENKAQSRGKNAALKNQAEQNGFYSVTKDGKKVVSRNDVGDLSKNNQQMQAVTTVNKDGNLEKNTRSADGKTTLQEETYNGIYKMDGEMRVKAAEQISKAIVENESDNIREEETTKYTESLNKSQSKMKSSDEYKSMDKEHRKEALTKIDNNLKEERDSKINDRISKVKETYSNHNVQKAMSNTAGASELLRTTSKKSIAAVAALNVADKGLVNGVGDAITTMTDAAAGIADSGFKGLKNGAIDVYDKTIK